MTDTFYLKDTVYSSPQGRVFLGKNGKWWHMGNAIDVALTTEVEKKWKYTTQGGIKYKYAPIEIGRSVRLSITLEDFDVMSLTLAMAGAYGTTAHPFKEGSTVNVIDGLVETPSYNPEVYMRFIGVNSAEITEEADRWLRSVYNGSGSGSMTFNPTQLSEGGTIDQFPYQELKVFRWRIEACKDLAFLSDDDFNSYKLEGEVLPVFSNTGSASKFYQILMEPCALDAYGKTTDPTEVTWITDDYPDDPPGDSP